MQITLKNLQSASAQQVYDQVARHLLKQNAQSIAHGACRYRGVAAKTGAPAMCAAGCLISDEEYAKDGEKFERKGGWVYLMDAGLVPGAHGRLVQALQQVHDCKLPHAWPKELTDLAVVFGLSSAVVKEVQNAN